MGIIDKFDDTVRLNLRRFGLTALHGWKAISKSNVAKPPFSAFSRVILALIRKNTLLPLDLLGQSLLNPPQY